ncbi:MAG: hypothetical protein DRO36_06315 [Candidatus Hecatellales archaeon]|nr:MAG: hypothetical protein DRO36_06315 [Candidatus Hecatellales archaeon]
MVKCLRTIFYTGKGGTGKTVISCMTALKSAELGYETLLMSSDPAHTLRDALNTHIGSEETKVTKNLWAVHVNPMEEAAKHHSELMEYFASVLSSRGLDETLAYEIANLPGITGIAALLKLEGYKENEKYDVIVMDSVPSGEALKLLFVPDILGRISKKLINALAPLTSLTAVAKPVIGMPTPTGKLVKKEIKVLEQMENLKQMLTNFDLTSVRLIANPDFFSLSNAKRTYMLVSLYGINVDLAVINKVFPKLEKDSYFHGWVNSQKKYIEELYLNLSPLPIKILKLYESELMDIPKLRKAADELFNDEDPTQVYHKGKPMTINRHNDGVEVVLSIPYVSREDIEIERTGDEMLVYLKTDIGRVGLIIPLPTITYLMSLKKAKLINGKLHLYFVKEK